MVNTGVVMFAFNTQTVDYVEIAARAAKLITHTLNLPTTLITDIEPASSIKSRFDQVVISNSGLDNRRIGQFESGSEWKNGNRFNAYDLSPYDTTILLDSDYLMLDTSLLTITTMVTDYQIMNDNRVLSTTETQYNMGITSLPYIWATAVVFRKTAKAKMLFDLVGRIQRNYQYYYKLYQVDHDNFRNDYAFTIANRMLNGYATEKTCSMPFKMLTVEVEVESISKHKNMLIIKDKKTAYAVPKQNMHVIDKQYLLSNDYLLFLETLCQD